MDLISVIIPVYNAEKYLSECLDSLVRQTYKNIEIILVDDGSKDSSGKICDEYAQKDTRIKVIHKENGGVSAARNTGLDFAQGEYVAFVDADDLIEPTYIEKMYNELIKNKADLCFCKYAEYIKGQARCVQEDFPGTLEANIHNKTFVDFIFRSINLKHRFFFGVWRILFKKDLIRNIRFHLGIKISEDLLFLLKALLETQRVAFIEDCLYFYRILETSAVHSYKKMYLQSQLNLYTALKDVFKQFKDAKSQTLLQIYNALLCYYVFSNELKFKQANRRDNINQARESELYKYFNLKNGLKIYGIKPKIKFLIVWFLVKTRMV